jgi:hypothetical protein
VVVAEEAHGRDAPFLLGGFPPEELGHDGIVPVGEDVSLDDDVVPDGTLDRIAAAIDLGADALYDDARRRSFPFCFLFIQV